MFNYGLPWFFILLGSTTSIFSLRIIDSDEVILVGEEQKYVPHCRDSFLRVNYRKEKINIK